MKGISKNIYSVIAIVTFALSIFFLVLILSLYSKSTAVDGTTVGNIYIGDQETKEAQRKTLISKVANWKREAQYTINFQNVEMTIGCTLTPTVDKNGDPVYESDGVTQKITKTYRGLEILEFDAEKTVENIRKDAKNNCYFTVNAEKLLAFKGELISYYGSKVVDFLDFNLLINNIVGTAEKMETISVFDLHDYVYDSYGNAVVNTITLEKLSVDDVNTIVEAYSEIEILPQEKTVNKLGFSAVKYFSGTTLTNDKLNIIATGLAAVVQKSSFTATVKNQDIFIRDYAYNDMTARINVKDGTDLKIINPETVSYTIKISKVSDSELKFDLVGCKFMDTYAIETNYDNVSMVPEKSYNQYLKINDATHDIIIDEEEGIFYYVSAEGVDSKLISYTRVATDIHGTVTRTPIYLKQEFYKGTAASWVWNYLPSDYVGGGE